MGWRRDHFSGLGKLEGDVQLCVTSRERLQSKTCLSALLPEISHMGKLVLGESVGSGGPRRLRGHGRTPAGIRTSARWPSEDFHRQSQTLRGGLSTRPFCNLLRSVIKLCKLGRLGTHLLFNRDSIGTPSSQNRDQKQRFMKFNT